jgi:hypothetical protein
MPNHTQNPAQMPNRSVGFIRHIARRLGLSRGRRSFNDSGSYWEQRYRSGGNSGAGSYGQLATFKADFLNRFVRDHGVTSVIEFGSGDGAQLALAEYPRYLGVDVARTAVDHCRALYRDRPGYSFIHLEDFSNGTKADLTLSLDVVYHLVEDTAFDAYMERLFDASARYVIIYSSNKEGRPVPHVRHRKFTDWVSRKRPAFRLIEHCPNAFPEDPNDPDNTSFADFYVYEAE